MKGISRPVIPYMVDGSLDGSGAELPLLSEHRLGITMYMDLGSLDAGDRGRARSALKDAIDMLDKEQTSTSSRDASK